MKWMYYLICVLFVGNIASNRIWEGDGTKRCGFSSWWSYFVFVCLWKNKVLVIDIVSGKKLFELPTGNGPDGIGYSPQRLPWVSNTIM